MTINESAETIDWIAVDWGTSRLRVFAMNAANRPIAERSSEQGMATLDPEGFEPALKALVADWMSDAPKPLLACGMVGARQGWVEADYSPVPNAPLSLYGIVCAPADDKAYRLRVLPGLCQQDPADVMRGEETQIAGFLVANPTFDGLLCLPGTHSKWARVQDGKVLSFTTYMTGEIFALLSGHSVLRHSLGALSDMPDKPGQTFLDGLERSSSLGGNLSSELFTIRARGLLQELSSSDAFDLLSGLLVGAELTSALDTAQKAPVALIGSGSLGARYLMALDHFGVKATQMETRDATLLGLANAYEVLKEAGEWTEN